MPNDNNEVIYEKIRKIFKNKKKVLKKDITWKNYSRMWGDKTHRICSYVAMFPPRLANYFIKKFSKENDYVFDTFSGRGTTILESRLLKRKAFGIDLNPFAYVLSRAKSKSYSWEIIENEINIWKRNYDSFNEAIILDENLKVFYSDENLRQLTFIKYKYGRNWNNINDVDNYILAIVLGLMHGPAKKNGESIYFSLSMSNCISMSKNYVIKYAKKHDLIKPVDDIFEKIKKRAKYIIGSSQYSNEEAKIVYGNSLNITNYIDAKPKLIFTSPPYLNIINYTQQNWIKMWLLGFEDKIDNNNIGLDDKHNLTNYVNFMINYMTSISKIMDKNSTLVIVIGEVLRINTIYSFDDMWKEKISKIIKNLKLIEKYTDPIDQNKKATNSMGQRAGKSTRIDKIYVFKKI
ncbi:DNA methyltransferase [Spiroplasma tabanidicola]|uniref:Methyltransferase n=1 Tax=Spiroplasma tabanidicola TaxID=324079 RepID=A0A6I6CC65_9MOLU|nr:DNA methyltransferase [Spiroplasma tabanidicola]QGS51848.1 type II R/M system DNA methylase [Spiroplasma tabanidicola]